MRDEVRDFRDLIVWRKMTSQMQRTVASIPANIAEGHKRSSRKGYARLIAIAPALGLADQISRMLNALRQKPGA